MTEKEFRKLRPLDLIQLLLAQGNEVSQMQAELDKKNEKLALLKEGNDILKAKLNDRDALVELLKVRLDKSDADIRELERKAEELYSDKWIDLDQMGSLTEAAQELYKIFEVAQNEAEQCIQEAEQRHGELPEGLEYTTAIETVYVDEPRYADASRQEAETESINIEETRLESGEGSPEEGAMEAESAVEVTAEEPEEPEPGPELEFSKEPELETESSKELEEPELKSESLKEPEVESSGEPMPEQESSGEPNLVSEPNTEVSDERMPEPESELPRQIEDEVKSEALKDSEPEAKGHNEAHKAAHRETHKETSHQNHRKKFFGHFLFGRHR